MKASLVARRKEVLGLFVLALVAVTGFRLVGTATGTPPSPGVTASILARGEASELVKMKARTLPYDVVVQQILIPPGGDTGWHSHPGPGTVVVKSGTFTIYAAGDPSCTPVTYSAGETYVDPGYGFVHIGRNEDSSNLELLATFLGVPPDGSPRIDVPVVRESCPF